MRRHVDDVAVTRAADKLGTAETSQEATSSARASMTSR